MRAGKYRLETYTSLYHYITVYQYLYSTVYVCTMYMRVGRGGGVYGTVKILYM